MEMVFILNRRNIFGVRKAYVRVCIYMCISKYKCPLWRDYALINEKNIAGMIIIVLFPS